MRSLTSRRLKNVASLAQRRAEALFSSTASTTPPSSRSRSSNTSVLNISVLKPVNVPGSIVVSPE
jgi:hypothetical protein